MPTFFLPTAPRRRPVRAVDDAAGADVAFANGVRYVAGAPMVVRRDDAAKQSVLREWCAPAGSFVRRPEWGIGATDALMRGATQATTSALVGRGRERMRANPRVAKTNDITSRRLDGYSGTVVVISYNPIGSNVAASTVRGPRR